MLILFQFLQLLTFFFYTQSSLVKILLQEIVIDYRSRSIELGPELRIDLSARNRKDVTIGSNLTSKASSRGNICPSPYKEITFLSLYRCRTT